MAVHKSKNKAAARTAATSARKKGMKASVFKTKKGYEVSVTRKKKKR